MNIKVHIFAGDSKEKASEIGNSLNIKNINYEMLPNDKYNKLKDILKNKNKNIN